MCAGLVPPEGLAAHLFHLFGAGSLVPSQRTSPADSPIDVFRA